VCGQGYSRELASTPQSNPHHAATPGSPKDLVPCLWNHSGRHNYTSVRHSPYLEVPRARAGVRRCICCCWVGIEHDSFWLRTCWYGIHFFYNKSFRILLPVFRLLLNFSTFLSFSFVADYPISKLYTSMGMTGERLRQHQLFMKARLE
jgi:hypothetical protein